MAKLEKELGEKHNKELAELNESTSQEKPNNELETKMENLSTNDAETTEVKKSSKAQRRRVCKIFIFSVVVFLGWDSGKSVHLFAYEK